MRDMAATTSRERDSGADLDLELELALRGFLRTDRGSGPGRWRRDVAPFVDVTIEGGGVQLACAGVGTACVEDRRDKTEVLRLLDDWLSRHTPGTADSTAVKADRTTPPVVATVLDLTETTSADAPQRGADSALPVRATESGSVIPDELWRLLSDQFDQVRELGDQLATARERAARAETEVVHLRSRLADVDAVPAAAVPAGAGSSVAPRRAMGMWRRLLDRNH